MNKKYIVTILIIVFIIGGIILFNKSSKNNGNNISSNSSSENNSKGNKSNINKPQTKKERIESLKKKLALKGLISKGDFNKKNGDYTIALIKYLQIHKEIPNDKSIINKLGNVYFELKNYKKAYFYYSQIKDYSKADKDKIALTLFSTEKINLENSSYIKNELDSIGLSEEQSFYYNNSVECIIDFSNCRKIYQEYFDNKQNIKIDTTSSGAIIKKDKYINLENINKSLVNYKNFKINDLAYKGALISGAYFENGFYTLAIETSKTLLKEKRDYKPLYKIIAKSYFELGNYVEAKVYIIKYNKLVKNDSEISYFLGIIYEKLHDYTLSNIHFEKAIKIGFTDIYDINKRMLYNYYEQGEIDKMLLVLKKIINSNNKSITTNDYELAIYYNIVNEKTNDALNYTKKALTKYPKSEIFNGYMGWILMDRINNKLNKNNSNKTGTGKITSSNKMEMRVLYNQAEKYITKGLKLNSKSPMVNLVKGKLEYSKGEKRKAIIYFKKTIALNNNGDFGKMAKIELERIDMNK